MYKKILLIIIMYLLTCYIVLADDNTYIDQENGFSITFPEGWEIIEEEVNGGTSISARSSLYLEAMIEVYSNHGQYIGDFRDYSVEDFSRIVNQVENLYKEVVGDYSVQDVLINDLTFYTCYVNLPGIDYEMSSYVGVYNDTAYNVTVSFKTRLKDDYKEDVINSIESFRIIDKPVKATTSGGGSSAYDVGLILGRSLFIGAICIGIFSLFKPKFIKKKDKEIVSESSIKDDDIPVVSDNTELNQVT